jgi:GAF domain-containing protein
LFTPLLVRGTLIGAIGLDLYSPVRRFTPELVDIASTMTAQVSIGLQNIRLLGEAQRRAEQLQRITAFSQSVQSSLDIATILNIMLAEIVQMVSLDAVTVALYDTRVGSLRTVAQYDDGRISMNVAGGQLISMNNALIVQAWEGREIVYIPDLQAETDIRRTQVSNLRSVLVVPIRTRGRMLGLVNLGALRAYAYTETDMAVVQQMMNQLAVAIENADTFAQSQRLARNEALVNEISVRLQAEQNIESMLSITMRELGQALGARRGRIRLATHPQDNGQATE